MIYLAACQLIRVYIRVGVMAAVYAYKNERTFAAWFAICKHMIYWQPLLFGCSAFAGFSLVTGRVDQLVHHLGDSKTML
jgi:hypothetical protein